MSRSRRALPGGFQMIIDGEMDQYPEAAFFNVGTIDDVIRKAQSMGGEN